MKPELEVIPQHWGSSIHAFQYEQKAFHTPWHYHSEFELTYVTKSNGIRYVGNSIENFHKGDFVLVGPSLPHVWKNTPNYDDGASSVVIQWKSETLATLISSMVEFQKVKILLEKANFGVCFSGIDESEEIGKKLLSLPTLKGVDQILRFLDILNNLAQLSTIRLLSEPGDGALRFHETDNRIQDIFDHIHNHYTRKITVDNMADLTYMTKSSFCKFFKKRFQKTFTQYLNEFRIHNVCQQLQETDLAVSQIAINCGYENLSYFHRQFRQVIGRTPAQYRSSFLNI